MSQERGSRTSASPSGPFEHLHLDFIPLPPSVGHQCVLNNTMSIFWMSRSSSVLES